MIVRVHSHPLYCDHVEQHARSAIPRDTSPVRGHSWSPRAPDLTRAPATGASVPMCNARHTSDTQKTLVSMDLLGISCFRVKVSFRTWGCRSPYTFPKGWVDNDDSVGPRAHSNTTCCADITDYQEEAVASGSSGALAQCTLHNPSCSVGLMNARVCDWSRSRTYL